VLDSRPALVWPQAPETPPGAPLRRQHYTSWQILYFYACTRACRRFATPQLQETTV
jgi:hypothetical protein